MLTKLKSSDQKTIQEVFKYVSALDALQVLDTFFGAANATVWVDARKYKLHELADLPGMACEWADKVQLTFYGGPPKASTFFNGTLSTMLMDHVMFCMAKGRQDVIMKAIEYLTAGEGRF